MVWSILITHCIVHCVGVAKVHVPKPHVKLWYPIMALRLTAHVVLAFFSIPFVDEVERAAVRLLLRGAWHLRLMLIPHTITTALPQHTSSYGQHLRQVRIGECLHNVVVSPHRVY